MSSKEEKKAMKRIDVIRRYWNGELSGPEAAKELDTSLPTFHKWEKRALDALLHSQVDRPAGRPKDLAAEARRKKAEVEKALEAAEERMLAMDFALDVKELLLHGTDEDDEPPKRKKKRGRKKGS